MSKILIKILGIIILVIFQVALFSKIAFWGTIPNIIIIVAIALSLKNHLSDSFLVASIGAISIDLISPIRFGIYTFLIVIVLILVDFVVLKTIPAPNYFICFLIFIGVFLFINLGIALFTYSWPGWSLVTDCLINGVWGMIILYIFSKLLRPENELGVA